MADMFRKAAGPLSVAAQITTVLLVTAAMKKNGNMMAKEPKAYLGVSIAMMVAMLILQVVHRFARVGKPEIALALTMGMETLRFLSLVMLLMATVKVQSSKLLWFAVTLLGLDTITSKMRINMETCDLWFLSRT